MGAMDETIQNSFGSFHFAIIFAHQHGIPIRMIAYKYYYLNFHADTLHAYHLHFSADTLHAYHLHFSADTLHAYHLHFCADTLHAYHLHFCADTLHAYHLHFCADTHTLSCLYHPLL